MTEDEYVTPAEWQRHLLPRRGGRPVPYGPEPGAAKIVAAAVADEAGLRATLTHARTPPDVSAAGLAHLGGDPGSTPLGAAAVAAFVVGPQQHTDARTSRAVADEWV